MLPCPVLQRTCADIKSMLPASTSHIMSTKKQQCPSHVVLFLGKAAAMPAGCARWCSMGPGQKRWRCQGS